MARPATMIPPHSVSEAIAAARAPRRDVQGLPLMDTAVDGGVKDERIQSNESEEDDFRSKSRIGIHLCCLRPEEQEAADEHDCEARPREWKYGARYAGNCYGAQDKSEHAKIEHCNRSNHEGDGDYMNRLNDAVCIVRLANSRPKARVIEKLAEMLQQ
jgi:hypothetical protein